MKLSSTLLLFITPLVFAQQQQQQQQAQSTTTTSFLRGGFHAPSPNPDWLNDYVAFHRQQRHMNDSAKYLVLDYDNSHNGSLERNLLHIPYYLWLASKSNRVFVLGDTWLKEENENCGLEHIWKPHHLDWTMPYVGSSSPDSVVELHHKTDNEYYNHFIGDVNMKQEEQARVIRVQGNPMSLLLGLGNVFQEDGTHDRRMFQEIFEIMFQLTEPLQQMLTDVQRDLGLLNTNNDSTEYIAVHLDTPVNLLANIEQTQQLHKTSQHSHALQAHLEQSLNFDKVVQRTKLMNGGNDNALLYCAGIDSTHTLPECVNDNGQLQSYAKHLSDNENDKCAARWAPSIIDFYLSKQASCIGFGDDDQGLAATLFGNFDCYSVHDMNPTIMNAAQRWDSPFYPNPSGRRRTVVVKEEDDEVDSTIVGTSVTTI